MKEKQAAEVGHQKMPLTGKRKRDEKKIIGNSLWSAVSSRIWDPCLPHVSISGIPTGRAG